MPKLQSALMALALLALPSPALADETAAPAGSLRARFGKALGRFEGPRDMNLFQLEPSILNERYYTSGESEHHQFVGNVLPAGAPIPDNEAAGNTTTGAKKQPTPLDDKAKPAPVLNRSTNTTQPALSQPATASTQEQKQSGNKQ
ncbi:MAG: hypothetical protein HY986_18360 [Candidatus Melainabacteria bacterium]|nr:hypothetical protein [Candidatus Melainabacteria bacterium]